MLPEIWQQTIKRLESQSAHIVSEEETNTLFWHRGKVQDIDGKEYDAWILVEHSPGDDPGHPSDLLVKVGRQWQCLRCMKDKQWARFGDEFMYRLLEPCPKDGYRYRQF